LRQPGAPDEHESMQLLLEAGLPALATRIVNDEREARAAAQAIGAPVVLKTAMRGIDHKSDIDGAVGLADADTTAAAYRELATRIGPGRWSHRWCAIRASSAARHDATSSSASAS
jgi:acyl-CoA synthetase (NDP forming)